MTFIDDHTHYVHLYFLATKDEVFDTFRRFRTMVEKQTGKVIKAIRSDNGTEYLNHDMQQYMATNGIRHETTLPDSPQQNGTAERYNRTILNSVRALMHTAGIPGNLWAELCATASYLRNRLPTTSNPSHKTPYELWHGKKPNLEHLRVIWSDAYAHVNKRKRSTKFSAQATKLKLIGYSETQKAYKL